MFLAPVGGKGCGEGQHRAPQPQQANISHTASFGGGEGISYTCRKGKAFGPKWPPHTASRTGDGGDGTEAGCSRPPTTTAPGLSRWSARHGLTGVTAITDREGAGEVQGRSSMG